MTKKQLAKEFGKEFTKGLAKGLMVAGAQLAVIVVIEKIEKNVNHKVAEKREKEFLKRMKEAEKQAV